MRIKKNHIYTHGATANLSTYNNLAKTGIVDFMYLSVLHLGTTSVGMELSLSLLVAVLFSLRGGSIFLNREEFKSLVLKLYSKVSLLVSRLEIPRMSKALE